MQESALGAVQGPNEPNDYPEPQMSGTVVKEESPYASIDDLHASAQPQQHIKQRTHMPILMIFMLVFNLNNT